MLRIKKKKCKGKQDAGLKRILKSKEDGQGDGSVGKKDTCLASVMT